MQPEQQYIGMQFPGHDHLDHLDIDAAALPRLDLAAAAGELTDLPLGTQITSAQPATLKIAHRIAADRTHVLVLRERLNNLIDFRRQADRLLQRLAEDQQRGD